MSWSLATLFGIAACLWFPLATQAQPPSSNPQVDQSAVLRIPVQATLQVEPGTGISDNNQALPGEVFKEAPTAFSGHFVGGAGVYIVKPFLQNNAAFITQTITSTNGQGTFSFGSLNQHDFSWGLDAAPVVWLGYAFENGLGVRARWWLFDQRNATAPVSDSSTTIISASSAGLSIATPSSFVPFGNFSPATQMFVSSNLKLTVWDFEATRELEVEHWALMLSAGFQYAHLSQNYNAFEASRGSLFSFIPFPENQIRRIAVLSSADNFNGAGPTIALEARRAIANSALSLFANLRGTMLFGQSKQQVDQPTVTQFGFFNPRTNVSVTSARSVQETVLPVAELEMGAEFSRSWGNVRPFIRTGVLAQTWFGAGSASSEGGNLGFLGLTVTAGLNY
jgi:hypothetical protein